MKNLAYYFKKAYRDGFAIGQFNFSDWSQVKGILLAGNATKAPIILGTSEGESKFVGLAEAVVMAWWFLTEKRCTRLFHRLIERLLTPWAQATHSGPDF